MPSGGVVFMLLVVLYTTIKLGQKGDSPAVLNQKEHKEKKDMKAEKKKKKREK